MHETSTATGAPAVHPHRTRDRWLAALGITLGVFLIAFVILGEYVAHHLGPILRSSVVNTLSQKFHSPVELDSLNVSIAKGLEVEGRGLRIFYLAGPTQPDLRQKMGKPAPPMLSVNRFSFRTSIHALLHLQANIARVDIDGMSLHIPPHSGAHTPHITAPNSRIKITVAEIYCRNVQLVIENADPQKEPLSFLIQNLKLRDVGAGQPMLYDALVINPKPIGNIHATGHFGPWHSDDPRSTAVDGHYSFTNANLGSIKGIGGTLSSTGNYTGRLDHITIDGTTTTPNFSLDISDHPLPLETTFHAYVDGTNGDTTLDPVQATLLHSHFTCKGTVVNIHGKGHDINLIVNMPDGRIEDLLALGMKAEPPIMLGAVTLDAKLHIPPGDVRVEQKIQLAGTVHIQGVEFTNAKLQDRIDSLSMRAQGKAKDAHSAGSDLRPEVASRMTVDFSLGNAMLGVSSLTYRVPGGQAQMHGAFTLNHRAFEFYGHIRTEAEASQMVTGWKSILLTPFDPFFKKHGAGLQLPISISGVGNSVHFGLAMHGADEPLSQIESDLRGSGK
ncbi:MAG: hypothetical protein WBY53_19280 [Acidobacteriaceae bacterium]